MKRYCYSKFHIGDRFIGEKPPFSDPSETHGICDPCLEKEKAKIEDLQVQNGECQERIFCLHLMGNWATREVYLSGDRLNLEESIKVRNHSPDGFSWSYGGSGPSQLALAILLKILPREVALTHYQDFKWNLIAKLPSRDFDIKFEVRVKTEGIEIKILES